LSFVPSQKYFLKKRQNFWPQLGAETAAVSSMAIVTTGFDI
jgi:hypothetical protein